MAGRLEDKVKKQKRMYNAKISNRADWAVLGFGGISGQVHNDDRALLLAELDMRKAERMLVMALSPETSSEQIHMLSTRNMNKIPTAVDVEVMHKTAVSSVVKQRLLDLLGTVDYATRQYRALEVSYVKMSDFYDQLRATAQAVAYANVASAFFRYAQAYYDWQVALDEVADVAKAPLPSKGSVFNAQPV